MGILAGGEGDATSAGGPHELRPPPSAQCWRLVLAQKAPTSGRWS